MPSLFMGFLILFVYRLISTRLVTRTEESGVSAKISNGNC